MCSSFLYFFVSILYLYVSRLVFVCSNFVFVCFLSCICLRLQGKFNAGEVRYSTKSKSFTAIQAEVLVFIDNDDNDNGLW